MVAYLYSKQREWDVSVRQELRDIGEDLYDKEGFDGLQQLFTELTTYQITEERILIILYIAIQAAWCYLQRGESFAIKYIIFELQKNMLSNVEYLSSNVIKM